MKTRIRKAVFPVAGLGTRFLPATKALPKEMLPVVDKPLIQYAVDEARAAGIEEFIFVTGRGKTAIEDHFDRSVELEDLLSERGNEEALELMRRQLLDPGAVAYTRQQHALGPGHAVWCARNLIGDEPFAVLFPDDLILGPKPCLVQMVEAHKKTGGNIVGVMEVPRENTGRYGVVDPGAVKGALVEVKGLVEKPDPAEAPSNLCLIGRYILEPEVLEQLDRQEKGAGGEIWLTDAMARMIGHTPFHGYKFAGRRFDCGDKAGFLQATIAFALERDDLREPVLEFLRELNGDSAAVTPERKLA